MTPAYYESCYHTSDSLVPILALVIFEMVFNSAKGRIIVDRSVIEARVVTERSGLGF